MKNKAVRLGNTMHMDSRFGSTRSVFFKRAGPIWVTVADYGKALVIECKFSKWGYKKSVELVLECD